MNQQRERQDTYYLGRIYDPVILYPDGGVGELANKNVYVPIELPSRIEGQKRMGKLLMPRLGEVAIHASLADYLVGKPHNVSNRSPYRNSWRLKDMPTETLAAYEAWGRATPPLDLDAVRELASTKVTSPEDRLTQGLPCPSCVHADHRYACYTCGYAQELYAYPLARYHDEETIYDVPIDVADMIRMNPKALAYETEWEIDDKGLMSATRRIVFNAQTIPKEYVTGEQSSEVLTIDPVDELRRNVSFVTDCWTENAAQYTASHRRTSQPHETPTVYTPESYLVTLQNSIAVHAYHERKEGKDYNAMIKMLQAEMGRRGLELAFEYRYMGMGDSEARFMAAKRIDDYVVTQPIAGSFIVEMAIEAAAEKLTKESR